MWADIVIVSVRGEESVSTLDFFYALDDQLHECARIQVTVLHLRRIHKILGEIVADQDRIQQATGNPAQSGA